MTVIFFTGIHWQLLCYFVKISYYFLRHRLPQVVRHALNNRAWKHWILVLLLFLAFLPILDNFGNKYHLRGAQRNTVIKRSRALPSRSSRTSLCIRHCLVSGIHMIFIRHVLRSPGGCSFFMLFVSFELDISFQICVRLSKCTDFRICIYTHVVFHKNF